MANMSATSTNTALEFRAWSTSGSEKKPLNETLARVHQERGSFRELTEASLQEEIATSGALELSSSDDEEADEYEEKAADAKRQPATTREELFKAKHEMMQLVSYAHNEILLSLQVIALMESKYAPGQASVSFSPDIKLNVPTGSMGTDVWDPRALPVNEAREAQDRLLASKVRMESLHNSADDLLAAATRLQENVRKETVFWNEILGVSEKGWRISRIPRAHALGVHFGFNGCAPEFAKRNIAALVGDSEGAITLERGIGTKPKAIRAVVKKQGQVFGASELPSLPAQGETTLDARIRHARDSVFDEELFHELLRESRTSTSLGVLLSGSSLCFNMAREDATSIELELVSLEEENSLPYNISHDSDALAKAMLVAARLLLGQKHREKIDRKREVPAPIAEKVEDEHDFSILRPLILLMKHHANVAALNKHLETMAQVIRTTQVSAECQTARIGLPLPEDDSINISSLLRSFAQPLKSEGMLWMILSDELTLELKISITTSDSVESAFAISQTSGQDLVFDNLTDTLAAADEVLSLLLTRALHDMAGDDWRFDARESILTRESQSKGTDTMQFDVDGASKTVILHITSSQGRKQAVWTLDDSGPGALEEVWTTLVS